MPDVDPFLKVVVVPSRSAVEVRNRAGRVLLTSIGTSPIDAIRRLRRMVNAAITERKAKA